MRADRGVLGQLRRREGLADHRERFLLPILRLHRLGERLGGLAKRVAVARFEHLLGIGQGRFGLRLILLAAGDEHFADLVALCQFLPGPASSQIGIVRPTNPGSETASAMASGGISSTTLTTPIHRGSALEDPNASTATQIAETAAPRPGTGPSFSTRPTSFRATRPWPRWSTRMMTSWPT